MALLVLVWFLAAAYGVRSGYRNAKTAARATLTEWAAGGRPESSLGRRAGMATGGLTWAAWQGARGFKNSFAPGFHEGAQKLSEWAQQKEWVRETTKATTARHVGSWRDRRKSKKAAAERGAEQGHRPEPQEQPDPGYYAVPPGPPVPPCEPNNVPPMHSFRYKPGKPLDPTTRCQCGDKTAGNVVDLDPSTPQPDPTPATAGSNAQKENATMPQETSVASLITYAMGANKEAAAVADDALGHAERAKTQAATAANEADGAIAAEFKDDVTGPLMAIADAMHAGAESAARHAIAMETVRASTEQALRQLQKHQAVADAAGGLDGGVNAMASAGAYQDA